MATANIRAVISAEDNASRVVSQFGSNVDKSSKKIVKSNSSTALSFNQVLVATAGLGIATHRLVGVISDTVDAANREQAALTGLSSITKAFKVDTDDAMEAAKSLAEDGLMTVGDAALGLKNLLAAGFNLDQATKLMERFKDSAAFGRQSALSFGRAVTSATEGIKNGNSILVDNAGVTKNLSVILEEAGFSAQDLMRATSDASVRQALFNGIVKETNAQVGDAVKLTGLFGGKQAQLSAKTTELKARIGEALQPALTKLLETIAPLVERFAKFASDNPTLVAAVLLITTGVIGLTAVLGTLGLAIMGLTPIFAAFGAAGSTSVGIVSMAFRGLTAMVATPLVMPAIVVAAALASLFSVVRAAQSVKGAIDAVNSSARAASNLGNDQQVRELQKQAAAARALGDTKKVGQLANAIAALSGGRALGGQVYPGSAYMVGENGPELFVPQGRGKVVPNNQVNNSANINVSFSGIFTGSKQEFRKLAVEVFKAYDDAKGMGTV